MNRNVLISIKPKFVEELLKGKKKFEYRKSIFAKEIGRVYIYSTTPMQRIVGFFEYTGFIKGTPEYIWGETKEYSGIDEEAFVKYYESKNEAYAIIVNQIHVFPEPINPKECFVNFTPPQSYMYIEGDI